MADQRTLKGVDAVLSWQAIDGDGGAHDPGTVTVTVTNSAGTTLATAAATTGAGSTARTYTLAAANIPDEDRLTAVWKVSGITVATTHVDVVGGYYASLGQVADRYAGAAGFDQASLVRQRNHAEDFFTRELGYSCVPRFTSETIVVTRTSPRLVVGEFYPRMVRRASVIDGTTTTALTATELANLQCLDPGLVDRMDGNVWTAGTIVTIGYTHGLDAPSEDIADVFLLYVQHLLTRTRTGISPGATAYSNADGTSVQLASPGPSPWRVRSDTWITGLRDVDRVLVARRTKRYGIA